MPELPERGRLGPSAHMDTFCRDRLPPAEEWPDLLLSLPEVVNPSPLNCVDVLLDRTIATKGADRRCLVWPGGTWTYADLRRRADSIAHVLVRRFGLVPGNRVLVRGFNGPWLAACWLAVVKSGGVVVPTMPLLRAAELRSFGDIAEPFLALCDHRLTADLVAAGIPGLQVVPYGGPGPDDLTVAAAEEDRPFTAVPTAADDVAVVAFTSGTTGRPKATAHFHRDVLAIGDTFSRQVLRPTDDDLFLTSAPLAFAFGLGAGLVFPLLAGAATVLLERATPGLLADAVERYGVTILLTAPTAYRTMLRDGSASALSRVRRCVSSGEPLPEALAESFLAATGHRLIDCLGSTEMSHAFISAADAQIRPGSLGVPVPGFEARVLGPDGAPVPDGQVGQLGVRGPTGCRYLRDPRQRVYVRDGWNVTGDAVWRDADGYFWYVARIDDMIVSSGYNIAGPEVENALLQHPDVVGCAVVGRPDEERGQAVVAYVQLRPGIAGDPAKAAELQSWSKREIAPYKCPREVSFVAAMPYTPSGKLRRAEFRQVSDR